MKNLTVQKACEYCVFTLGVVALLILFMLTSCEKAEQPTLIVTKQSPIISTTTDTMVFFSMIIPQLNINEQYIPINHRLLLVGCDNTIIGNTLFFLNNTLNIAVYRLNNGTIIQLAGNINNHSFVVFNDSLNICSGPQHVPFTYSVSP